MCCIGINRLIFYSRRLLVRVLKIYCIRTQIQQLVLYHFQLSKRSYTIIYRDHFQLLLKIHDSKTCLSILVSSMKINQIINVYKYMVHESFFSRPKVVQIWVHEDDKLNVLIHPSVFKGKIFLRFTKCNQVMLFRVYFNP